MTNPENDTGANKNPSGEYSGSVMDRRRFVKTMLAGAGAVLLGETLLNGLAQAAGRPPDRQKSPKKLTDHRIGVGVHVNCLPMTPEQRELVFESLKDNNIGWARINLNWNDLEPEQGIWDSKILESLDDCINRALGSGVRPIVVVQGSPEWANGGKDWMSPPDNPTDYANALSFLARRYKGAVKAWQIWNEPNLDKFWRGSPQQMVELMEAAYPAVKEADPKAYVLSPGIAQNDYRYLEMLYKAGKKDSFKNSFDVLATHDYNPVSWIMAGVKSMIEVANNNGDTQKPIWLTEFGVPVSAHTSETDQEEFAKKIIKLLRTIPRLKMVSWFQAMDAGSGDPREKGLAAIDRNGLPRSVLAALAKAAFGTK